MKTERTLLHFKNNKLYYSSLFFEIKLNNSDFNNIDYDGENLFFRYISQHPLNCIKEYYIQCSSEFEANKILTTLGLYCLKTIKPSNGEKALRLFRGGISHQTLYGQSFLGTPEQLLILPSISDITLIKDPIEAYDKSSNFLEKNNKKDSSAWLITINNSPTLVNGKGDPMFGSPASLGVCLFYNKIDKLVPHDILIDITNVISPIEFAKMNDSFY